MKAENGGSEQQQQDEVSPERLVECVVPEQMNK